MLSSIVSRAAWITGALLVSGCTLQRSPAMSRRSADEPVLAGKTGALVAAAKPAVEPADEPVVGSEPYPGSDIVRAHASVEVRVPPARVRAVLFDCPSYPTFLASYHACTDLGPLPAGEGRTWLMDFEELGGMIKLKVKVAIARVPAEDGVEIWDGRLVEGNIRSFSSRWKLEPTPRGFTRLTLESHLDPKLPFPASLINGGSVDGIRDAILAIKRRAERDDAEARR
jgi:hypothetical protein